MLEEYIELNRDFYPVSKEHVDEYGMDFESRIAFFGTSSRIHWGDLLKEPRVVILAQAGAGKTYEIQWITENLRSSGEDAFFLRLEHLCDDFELAFEGGGLGEYSEFQQWIQTAGKAWIFLDSVDEAKLRDPGDFEKALKRLKIRLGDKIQQVNIVITSRLTWEPKTERLMVERLLPYHPARTVKQKPEDLVSKNSLQLQEDEQIEEKNDVEYPKIYSLVPLNDEQIRVFASAKGVTDTKLFMDAINRADANNFASRPQDLSDLIDYWDLHKKIGTRLELIESSIKEKLVERDTKRSELRPLAYEKARTGVELIAAVNTLTAITRISVPEKAGTEEAVPIAEILPDWEPKECKALLEMPIFDEAVYGTVRFHHRSVREYLTAQWFLKLLSFGTRSKVENIFFRVQYGHQIVTPVLRPILPWAALADDRFRIKALKVSPDVLLEGGDPSQFPLEVRSRILETLCMDMSQPQTRYRSFDIAAIERFSNKDIEEKVSLLIDQYLENEDIRHLLLRMVWRGQLGSCVAQIMPFVIDKDIDESTRIYAVRAIAAAGSAQDQKEVVKHFVENNDELSLSIISSVVEEFSFQSLSAQDLLTILGRLPNPGEFNSGSLDYSLSNLVKTKSLEDVESFVEVLALLLIREPFLERHYCEVSEQHSWLIKIAADACERLIVARSQTMLKPNILNLLSQYSTYRESYGARQEKKNSLSELVSEWSDLNEQLFWHDVFRARDRRDTEIRELWQVGCHGHFWKEDRIDFLTVLDWVKTRESVYEKRICLSLAFIIYVRTGRNRKCREEMKEAVKNDSELIQVLQDYLKPPAQSAEMKKMMRQQKDWKRQQNRRNEKKIQNQKDWKIWLANNIANITDTKEASEGRFFNSQRYLFGRMRDINKDHNKWGYANWRDLVEDQCLEVAEAFRELLVKCWRIYNPILRSEGLEDSSSVSYGVIFGLSGLAIEIGEKNSGVNLSLTEKEAKRAVRFSLLELNGLPDWLPLLHENYPEIVEDHFLKEIMWELIEYSGEKPCHYALDALAWHGEWLRGKIGNRLFKIIQENEPKTLDVLRKCLKIVLDSDEFDPKELEKHAVRKIREQPDHDNNTIWFAVSVSINPESAIPHLERVLKSIEEGPKATDFAMKFIVELVGGRRNTPWNISENYKQANCLEQLYLLIHKYVKVADDINRSGGGVYSPQLRDDAQDARRALFSMLTDIPGKATFLALGRILENHPDKEARPWMYENLMRRVEQDADLGNWDVESVIDFAQYLERKPKNGKQLYELSVDRLLDLKDELENAEDSVAATWCLEKKETKLRILIAKWLRDLSSLKYSVHQEEEQADDKRPDIRTHGFGFDKPVPIELKIVDNDWSGPYLFERLENQLCNDYLRDFRTSYGVFLLVYQGSNKKWEHPKTGNLMDFAQLLIAVQQHGRDYIQDRVEVEDIAVVGIDLTARSKPIRFSRIKDD